MRSKYGIKAFILAMMAAALGTMALGAVSAQAALPGDSTAGLFLINLGNALLATIAGAQVGEGKLLVEGRKIEIKCTGGTLNNGKIDTATDGLVEVTFTGCLTFQHNGVQIPSCLLKDELELELTSKTIRAKALALPILHEGINYVLFEPQEANGNFAVVKYHANLGCVLPLNNPVKGSVTAEVIEGDPAKLVFSEAIQLLTGDELLFGTFPSYIGAEAEAELTGEHEENQKLGVH